MKGTLAFLYEAEYLSAVVFSYSCMNIYEWFLILSYKNDCCLLIDAANLEDFIVHITEIN